MLVNYNKNTYLTIYHFVEGKRLLTHTDPFGHHSLVLYFYRLLLITAVFHSSTEVQEVIWGVGIKLAF